MHIRKATAADCPQIMKLIQELADYEKAPDEVTVSLEHFIESGFGEKPVWEAFVATSPQPSPLHGEGAVVGFALYYIRYSTWKGQRMYLEDLLVTDSMRGKGIGKLLFDALIEECKAKKYSGLVWQVLDWNEPAINFYKKFDGVKFDSEWVNCSLNF
jgi:L-amino acid N-acyltransferase YncA